MCTFMNIIENKIIGYYDWTFDWLLKWMWTEQLLPNQVSNSFISLFTAVPLRWNNLERHKLSPA